MADFRDERAPVAPSTPDDAAASAADAPDAPDAPVLTGVSDAPVRTGASAVTGRTGASAVTGRTAGRAARATFVITYLAAFLVGAAVFAFTGGIDPVVATWGNLAIVVVFAAVGSWVYRDTWARSFRLTRERPWVTFGLFVAGLVSIFVLPTIVSLVVLVLGGSPTGMNQAQLVAALGGADTWWVIALAAVVFGPIVEELVFREGLAWRWRHRLPAWLLIVGSSLLFGLWHLKDVADLVSVLVYASMGLVLAGTMWLTRGNLLVAVLVHALRNLASVALLVALA